MKKVKIKLKPIINNINLPTVIKTTILPGEYIERLFFATQIGEIFYIKDDKAILFLDIKDSILEMKDYSERGLIGLEFHPNFSYNGLFYLHYTIKGFKGESPLTSFEPNPCKEETLHLKWEERDTKYDHVDTVEEWFYDGTPNKIRTLLNLKRPFKNHNGFNSLNFSPETGKLTLITGDGGFGNDPFNLSQNNMEIAGKIIEIDITKNVFIDPPIVTRFDELPLSIQESLNIIGKGIRNASGLIFQKYNDYYIKYIAQVGQSNVESIYSFIDYKSTLVNKIKEEYLINFGWRAWEGIFPTPITKDCLNNLKEKTIAYFDEALQLSDYRLNPLTCSFHEEIRKDKFKATAITGIRPYMGTEIPELTGKIVFADLIDKNKKTGILAYTDNGILNDYTVIDIEYEKKDMLFVGLGSNLNHSKLYLGVYNGTEATKLNQGTIFEIMPIETYRNEIKYPLFKYKID